MKITKRQLKRIIKEEHRKILKEQEFETPQSSGMDHHWPRIDWSSSIGELVDKWVKMEEESFDPGDPSMTQDGELSQSEAKSVWANQVDGASMDLENEITVEIRKVVLASMQKISNQLINGEYL